MSENGNKGIHGWRKFGIALIVPVMLLAAVQFLSVDRVNGAGFDAVVTIIGCIAIAFITGNVVLGSLRAFRGG